MRITQNIKNQYKIEQTKKHYENFTVGSLVLGRDMKEAITTLYAFARLGDDIADEGNKSKEDRLKDIKYLNDHLKKIETNQKINDPYFKILKKICIKYNIKINNLYKFINAFNKDINHKQYTRFDGLIKYCEDAANPAGELVLSLAKKDNKENIRKSNAICTALALINFAQGAVEDYKKGRIYFPKSEIKAFNLNIKDIEKRNFSAEWIRYKKFWVNRNYQILKGGLGLGKKIKGRLGFEIQMIELASLLLLERMKKNDCNLFINPPKIRTLDWIFIFLKASILKLS
ncbi:MAG: squalene/phytoene synthase family protein [Candidatus Methylopumilus sp.]|jgi:squalene synthase HpnC